MLLPHVAMADVFRNPQRFRHRLLGTFITALYGRDSTGKWIDETLYGKNAARMMWIYQECVGRKEPVAVREALTFARKDWVAVEGLLMPLFNESGDVYMIFGGIDSIAGSPPLNDPDWRVILDWDN
jgi:hypothetical protein